MDLTEAEDIKKKWQEFTELYKKDLHDQDNHDGMINHIERLLCPWISRQEYWSGLPFPPQGIFLTQDQTCVSCVSCTADEFFTS